jgi:hypothetical protein
MQKYRVYLLLLLLTGTVYAQRVYFLEMQQSPLLLGAGWIGAAVPNTNADGFYFNPAQLGNFSRVNNFSLFFLPNKSNWGRNDYSKTTFNSFAVALGYNFNKNNQGLPLSVGIGYLHHKFHYFVPFYTIDEPDKGYSSYDSFDCLSIGASYKYFLIFNLGMSIKSFDSDDSEIPRGNKVSRSAFDFGAMITAPISKLFFDNYKFELGSQSFIKPNVNFTLSYSLQNIGKEFSSPGAAQAVALPRLARLGYTLDFGFEYTSGYIENLNVFNYSFTAEAEDILVKDHEIGSIEYENIFGDIGIKNLIALKGDQDVVMNKGHIFRLLETVILATGRSYGANYVEKFNESNAFGLSSDGLFKVLNNLIDNDVIKYITNHFTVEYYNANVFASTSWETNIKGIVLNFRGLEF